MLFKMKRFFTENVYKTIVTRLRKAILTLLMMPCAAHLMQCHKNAPITLLTFYGETKTDAVNLIF